MDMMTLVCPNRACRMRVYITENALVAVGGGFDKPVSLELDQRIFCGGQNDKPYRHSPRRMTLLKKRCTMCERGWTCEIHQPVNGPNILRKSGF